MFRFLRSAVTPDADNAIPNSHQQNPKMPREAIVPMNVSLIVDRKVAAPDVPKAGSARVPARVLTHSDSRIPDTITEARGGGGLYVSTGVTLKDPAFVQPADRLGQHEFQRP